MAVKLLFSWLVRQGQLGFDPAAAIELPKVERRLPEATLSAEEAEAVLAGPDVTTPLGSAGPGRAGGLLFQRPAPL